MLFCYLKLNISDGSIKTTQQTHVYLDYVMVECSFIKLALKIQM
jgi:hypothetical protein